VNLRSTFQRVYVINLLRRPERLAAFQKQIAEHNWPFNPPILFSAIDGDKVPCPPEFKQGGGAFGCRQSHVRILEQCLMEDVESVLILEDDAQLLPNFSDQAQKFLSGVPTDWEGLYLGGQHLASPVAVCPGIVRATDVERTHAYACRGRYMRALYCRWVFTTEHIDWAMRNWQHQFRIYCPERFLIAQARSRSDINGRLNAAQSWNPPTGNEPVVFLRAPRTVADEVRHWGLHMGFNRDAATGIDVGLKELFEKTKDNPFERIAGMSDWIRMIQAEVVSEPGLICTVWHPDCNENTVRCSTTSKVIVVDAATSTDVRRQLPEELQLEMTIALAARVVVLLRTPASLLHELRQIGFHTGYWRNSADIDVGLVDVYATSCGVQRIEKLQRWFRQVQQEAESITDGVVAVWHPEATATELTEATGLLVVEVTAQSVEGAKRQLHALQQRVDSQGL
jgi:hypothetical protein